MTTSAPNRHWLLIIILLVIVIAAGSMVAWSRYSRSQPIEISTPPAPELRGEVYIGGAVINPGIYPLKAGDSIDNLIEAAGGITGNAQILNLKIDIAGAATKAESQKIDINRAEAWLLEALPGIGEARAKAIIEYRTQNGAFSNINELLKVTGLSSAVFDQIKTLVTVSAP